MRRSIAQPFSFILLLLPLPQPPTVPIGSLPAVTILSVARDQSTKQSNPSLVDICWRLAWERPERWNIYAETIIGLFSIEIRTLCGRREGREGWYETDDVDDDGGADEGSVYVSLSLPFSRCITRGVAQMMS